MGAADDPQGVGQYNNPLQVINQQRVGTLPSCTRAGIYKRWDGRLSAWPITKHGMPLLEQCTSLGPRRAAWDSHMKNATDLVCFQNNWFISPGIAMEKPSL